MYSRKDIPIQEATDRSTSVGGKSCQLPSIVPSCPLNQKQPSSVTRRIVLVTCSVVAVQEQMIEANIHYRPHALKSRLPYKHRD